MAIKHLVSMLPEALLGHVHNDNLKVTQNVTQKRKKTQGLSS